MKFQSYRNILHKQMILYLHFMKCTESDDDLLKLSAEVTCLRSRIEEIDQMEPSELKSQIKFEVITKEGLGYIDIKLNNETMLHFNRKVNSKLMREDIRPRRSKYAGINFNVNTGRYVATLKHKGTTFMNETFATEQAAVLERDRIILKYNLPNPLRELKRNFKL